VSTAQIVQALAEHAWPLTWASIGGTLVGILAWFARRVFKSRTASYLAHVEALRWSRRRTGLPEDKLHELIVEAARRDLDLRDPRAG
jgi:hypothetical protein